MRRLLLIGLVAGSLTACGDDGGSGGESSGSTGPGTTTTDPTVDPSASTGSSSSSTDPTLSTSSSTTDESSTTDAETSSSTGPGDSSSSSGGPVAFELTSPAFEQDGLFPVSMHIAGGNVHPQLDWVGAPADTMSIAVFFFDVTFSNPHSGIWNIAPDVVQLPEGLEQTAMPAAPAGAVQCRNWTNNQFGYGGPGTPSNDYEFTIYALDVADLDGEIDQDSSLTQVRAAFEAHAIETTTLGGQTVAP